MNRRKRNHTLLISLSALFVNCGSVSQIHPHRENMEGWSSKTIRFSGYTWMIRESDIFMGAGPNQWSSKPQSVWLDERGCLHLRLRRTENGWRAAEVAMPLPNRYVRIEAEIEGNLGNLDPSVVAAVFIYRNDKSELDIEFSRWGNPNAPNAQFVVAPPIPASRRYRFHIEPGWRAFNATIDWNAENLHFGVRSQETEARWEYDGVGIPQPSQHWLHINLWPLSEGPQRGEEVEILIRRIRVY